VATPIKKPFLQPALIVCTGLILTGRATAQTFTNPHSFKAFVSSTNSVGANPKAGVVLLGNSLDGTSIQGGDSGNGTVFKVNIDGTRFTTLHNVTGGSDGANPQSDLVLA
jgi:uncharacterized repeat protein (TIGR03803 family)